MSPDRFVGKRAPKTAALVLAQHRVLDATPCLCIPSRWVCVSAEPSVLLSDSSGGLRNDVDIDI